jgi:hypothetical protein
MSLVYPINQSDAQRASERERYWKSNLNLSNVDRATLMILIMRSALLNLGQWCNTKPPKNLKQLDLLRISLILHSAFFLVSERRSTVDVRRRPGYKIWRLFKFSSILLSFKTWHWLKFKLEKAPNFVTRPASNVDRRTPFGSEKKCGVHNPVKCVVIYCQNFHVGNYYGYTSE